MRQTVAVNEKISQNISTHIYFEKKKTERKWKNYYYSFG